MKVREAAQQLESLLEQDEKLRAHHTLLCDSNECSCSDDDGRLWTEQIPAARKALREALFATPDTFEPVADFEARGLNDVHVRILYKGTQRGAWYHDGRFYFNGVSMDCYLTECIKGVKLQ